MKKLSLVFILVALMAVCLVGATAFADSGVVTYENIYIGEYDHGHPDYPNEKEVVIVFGQASVEESANVTSRGIVVTKGDQKFYFPAKSGMVDENGRFGVALVKATILDGDFTAKAYATVGGTYNAETKWWDGATIDEGTTELELAIDNVQISQTQTEITVTKDQSVDLKELITISGAEKSDLTYTTQTEDTAAVDIADGVVSYKSGHGTVTVTATHVLSGESVSFTSTVWEKVIEVKDKESFLSLAGANSNTYAYFTSDVEFWQEDLTGKESILGNQCNAVIDGQGYTLRYNRDYATGFWYGITNQFSEDSIIKNLVLEADAHVHSNFNSLFAHDVRGIVENCYFKTNVSVTYAEGTASGSLHYSRSNSLSRYLSGTYRNVVIESLNTSPICTNGTSAAKLENVAWITPGATDNFVGGMYVGRFTNEQMNNLCYYSSFDNFVAGTGSVISLDEETAKYAQTAFETTPQNLGSAWTVDATNGVSLNGKVVRPATTAASDYASVETSEYTLLAEETAQIKTYYNGNYNEIFSFASSDTNVATVSATSGLVTAVAPGRVTITATHRFSGVSCTVDVLVADKIVTVTTKETFISEMSSATAYSIINLGADLTFETTDFIKETESNGASNGHIYDMYVFETFKGTLIGNEKTITYTFSPEDGTDIRLRGFFEKVESTAKVIGVKIVGTVDIPYSFQTAFAEANYGVFDSCYIDVKATMQDWDGNSYNTIGLFGRNDGYIQNSILVIDAKRNNQSAWQGMKIVHNGSDSTAGRIVNVALIQTAKRIGTRNNANANSYIKNEQLSNLVYYSSLSNFLAGTGELVTNESDDKTFEYTAITSAQNIGSAWTVDSTGIKLNGTYVYEVTAE